MRDAKAKLAHIDACLSPKSQYEKSAGFDQLQLMNQAGLDIALSNVSTEKNFLGQILKAPLMIAPMTGGVEKSALLNERWAKAAQHFGIPMGIGSQRVALEDHKKASSFHIRKVAPDVFIFANLGAAQIAQGMPAEQVQRAIDMIEANALFIHFNALQEACQNGDVDFKNLTKNMQKLCKHFSKQKIPVFAREVCFGLSKEAAKRFMDMGFSGIDCAGAGGTSWSKVEALCAKTERQRKLGFQFGEWGIPTAQSIENVRAISQSVPLIATGGIRSGQDILKALHLGADIASMAQPMLVAAHQSEQALFEFIEDLIQELRVALFASGQEKLPYSSLRA
ncbi:MAG: type 2 isopentenyl-diphosphate Delta-isomerase [Deltaproteobacteria bacterium]|nr:type 2 isopentenyl-diphosphate Delta-isomerase [Deltaproteobacteria bacterium]